MRPARVLLSLKRDAAGRVRDDGELAAGDVALGDGVATRTQTFRRKASRLHIVLSLAEEQSDEGRAHRTPRAIVLSFERAKSSNCRAHA